MGNGRRNNVDYEMDVLLRKDTYYFNIATAFREHGMKPQLFRDFKTILKILKQVKYILLLKKTYILTSVIL